MDWRPTKLDTQFRDAVGHTFLHAAIYSQDKEHSAAIIKSLELGQEDVRVYLSTAWPSHAPGLTPLACSVSSLANWETFKALLSFSGKDLCCGSSTGTTGHMFCALACAIRDQEDAVVEALVQKSSQQKAWITDCFQWAMNCIPSIPLVTSYRLVEAVRRNIEGSRGYAAEVLAEHEV